MQLFDLPSRDQRIDQICRDGLPGQPYVAAYLAARLRACKGSVLVARMFVAALAKVSCGQVVSQDDVERLGVDDQDALLREVYPACNDDLKRDLSCELCAAFHEDSELYLVDDGQPQWRRLKAVSRVRGGDDGQPRWRPPASISELCRGELRAVFNCAYAMLCGVDIDPREAARARASQRPTG